MRIDLRRAALLVSFACVARLDAVGAQDLSMGVDLDPAIECWYHDAFPELLARFETVGVEKSRLYFRCSLYADYYFVDLEATASGEYRGVGPMAEESCPSVSYYVEAVTHDFESFRTSERVAEVTDHAACRRRFPAAAFFPGDPDIVLGSVSAGVPRMAPGFQAIGIKSFLSAAGELASAGTAGGGGGISPAVLAGIGAGAGGVTLAAVGGEDPPAPEAPAPVAAPAPPSSTTTSPVASPPPPGGGGGAPVRACFDTEPEDATIAAGESIRLDARCSTGADLYYAWDLGDGRQRDGAFISPTYRDPGTFTVTLTVTQPDGATGLRPVEDRFSRQITVEAPPAPLVACFNAVALTPGNNCDMKFDASCSQGDIVAYDWVLDATDVMGAGPYPEQGVSVVHDWTGYSGCMPYPPWPSIVVKLTVTDESGQTDAISKNVDVQYLRGFSSETRVPSSFSSLLTMPGDVAGRLTVNESGVSMAPSGVPAAHTTPARRGDNRVTGIVTGAPSGPGEWRFDFRETPGFVPGSLTVVQGQVLARDAHGLVLRLSGASGETIVFGYRLER